MSRMIAVGKVKGPVGLKGSIKVRMYTAGLRSLGLVLRVSVKGHDIERTFDVEDLSLKGATARLKLKGVDSVEDAQGLKGLELLIDATSLPKLEQGEYYHYELIGMEVYSLGRFIGIIDSIFETGSNDVYCVKRDGREYLIPAVDSVVKKIDKERKRMEIELIDGLGDDQIV